MLKILQTQQTGLMFEWSRKKTVVELVKILGGVCFALGDSPIMKTEQLVKV